jgi:hypothetical protein
MAQRNLADYGDVTSPEIARRELERLAAEQGVQPVTDLSSVTADFWPENENVDDFVLTVRERRRASELRSIE